MSQRSNIITTTRKSAPRLLLLMSAATLVFAHEGFDHVMGTVVKTSGNVVTVNTGKATVDVKLDEKTELTKVNDKGGSQKAQFGDLKPGVRVVVDIPEGNKDKTAHSVKIGVAASDHVHDSHK